MFRYDLLSRPRFSPWQEMGTSSVMMMRRKLEGRFSQLSQVDLPHLCCHAESGPHAEPQQLQCCCTSPEYFPQLESHTMPSSCDPFSTLRWLWSWPRLHYGSYPRGFKNLENGSSIKVCWFWRARSIMAASSESWDVFLLRPSAISSYYRYLYCWQVSVDEKCRLVDSNGKIVGSEREWRSPASISSAGHMTFHSRYFDVIWAFSGQGDQLSQASGSDCWNRSTSLTS